MQESQLAKCLLGNLCGASGHQLGCVLHLGERHYVTQALCAYHLHYQTVQTQRHTAVRRCAVTEGIQQVTELGVGFLVGKTQQLEDLSLQNGIGNTDRAGGQLDAVQNQVVAFCTNVAFVRFQIRQTLVHYCGEGMVHCQPLAALFVVFEEGELNHPQEGKAGSLNAETVCRLQTKLSQLGQQLVGVAVCHSKEDVAILAVGDVVDRLHLFLGHKLGEGGAGLLCTANPCNALGTTALGVFHQLVDVLTGHAACRILQNDGTNASACLQRAGEHGEAAVLHSVGKIADLHTEADVGLIGAVTLHHFFVGISGNGHGKIDVHGLKEQSVDISLCHGQDVLHVHKAHLQIDLGELRLTVCAKILVAEATGNLHVAVKACHHGKLLVQLGRLGQCVERAGMHAGGNQVVSCTLGGGTDQIGSLDLDKAVLIEIVTGDLGHAVTEHQILLQFAAAEIQIAVFETNVLGGLAIVHDLKGRHLALAQDLNGIRIDLHLAGGDLRIDAGTNSHRSAHGKHELVTAGRRLLKQCGIGGIVKCQLNEAGTVSQIQEQQITQISLLFDPAHHTDSLACMLTAKLAATVGAAVAAHQFCHLYSPSFTPSGLRWPGFSKNSA